MNMIDISGLEMLYRLNANLDRMGITLHLSEVKAPVMRQLEATTFLSLHGSVFFTTDQAMRDLGERVLNLQLRPRQHSMLVSRSLRGSAAHVSG